MPARRDTDSDNWGGARPGSGRPPKIADPVTVSVILPRAVLEAIDQLAADKGVKRGEVIRRLLAKDRTIAAAFKQAEL